MLTIEKNRFIPTLAFKRARPLDERRSVPIHSTNRLLSSQESRGPKPGIFLFTELQNNTRRNQEFVNHLKMKLLYKHLDEIIIEFLFQQYTELNLENENFTDDLNDPNFRAKFIKNNRRLINLLRDKLCRNKQFFSSLFTKTFMNVVLEENQHQHFLDSLATDTKMTSFEAQSIDVKDQTKNEVQPPTRPNHHTQKNFWIRTHPLSPKRVNIGTEGASSEEQIGKTITQDYPLVSEFKPEKLPDITTTAHNTLSTQDVMHSTTASIIQSKFPKLTALNKTLSSFSFRKGANSKLEVQLSPESKPPQKPSSQFKVNIKSQFLLANYSFAALLSSIYPSSIQI